MQQKLLYSTALVERAFAENNISKENRAVLAFSGGIDSTCVLNLPPVLKGVKDGYVDLLFNDTLVEFPQTRAFIKSAQEELGANVIVSKPKVTFKQVVERYGFPIFPRGVGDYSKGKAAAMCCHYLKKEPTKRALAEHNWTLYLTGLRADENYNRRIMAKRYGDYFFSSTYGHKKCHPILHWTREDIWSFQKESGFRHSELYDKVTYLNDGAKKYEVRTGCWCCPQGIRIGKLKWMREHFPKMFKTLVVKMGLGDAILDARIKKNEKVASKKAMLMRDINYKTLFGVERAIEVHPCYFDKW